MTNSKDITGAVERHPLREEVASIIECNVHKVGYAKLSADLILSLPGLAGGPMGEGFSASRDHARSTSSALDWRPIETAPRDGTEILVSMTHSLGHGEWQTLTWVDWQMDLYEWPIFRDRIDIPFPPTHWMPLPAAPSDGAPMRPTGSEAPGRTIPSQPVASEGSGS